MTTELRTGDVLPGEDEIDMQDAAEVLGDIYDQHGVEFILHVLIGHVQMHLHEALDSRNTDLSERQRVEIGYLGGREINALRYSQEHIAKGVAIIAERNRLHRLNTLPV